MKKHVTIAAALVMIMTLTGCSCWCPKNDTCVIPHHDERLSVDPAALTFVQPAILPSKEAFRPVFTAGPKRLSATGDGFCRDVALDNAVGKFCLENNCDMIVAAKAVVQKTTHPYWFFFSYDSYRVYLSGIPVSINGLTKDIAPVAAPKAPALTKEDVQKIVVNYVNVQEKAKKECAPALLTLNDIKLNMTATAATDSKVAVKLPADCK